MTLPSKLSKNSKRSIGLYLDFPFCLARCSFCAFNIRGYRKQDAMRYFEALEKEIGLHAVSPALREKDIATIYLGGGTPTLYPTAQLIHLIQSCRDQFHLDAETEISLEIFPTTITLFDALALKAGGVNRISIGAQSFLDVRLKQLGRHHTANDTRHTHALLREAGFANISFDLLYGLPDTSSDLAMDEWKTTLSAAVSLSNISLDLLYGLPDISSDLAMDEWKTTLSAAVSLSPEHLSLYGLEIEEGTAFHRKGLCLPSETEQIAQYQYAIQYLETCGYLQYEISNFAKPGFPSQHNLRYWNREEVLGVGLSAHSYTNMTYYANTDSLSFYCTELEGGRLPIQQMEQIDAEKARQEQIIFGLRKREGIPLDYFERDTLSQATLTRLTGEGLMEIKNGRASLSNQGLLFADEVAIAFF